MIAARTCSDEQLSIKAWPTAIRATSDPRSVARVETGVADQYVEEFIF
jgi:hypothetical protein